MQSESAERNAYLQDHLSRPLDGLPPFSDTSSFVDIPEIVRELVGEAETNDASQTAAQTNPPSSFQPPSSTQDDLDSLLRHAAQQGDHLTKLRAAASSFMRRHQRVAFLRNELLLLRSRAQFEWIGCTDQRRFVSESHERFLTEAEAVSKAPFAEISATKLMTIHDQVERDHNRQAEHLARTYNTESQLSTLEYSVQQKEFRLAQAAQKIIDALELIDLPEHGGSQSSAPPSLVNEDEIPSLVQYYFDRAGDVGLARDAIIDLQIEHREERERRQLQEDQGIRLPVPEDEFEDTFGKQVTEAEAYLTDTLRRAENAKQVCIDSDLDPELYRHRLRQRSTGSDHSISDAAEHDEQESQLPTETPNANTSPLTLPVKNEEAVHMVHGSYTEPRFAAVTNPFDFVVPDSLILRQSLSDQNRPDAAPFQDRIIDWMDDVNDGGVPETSSVIPRTKSFETVLDQPDNAKWRINRATSNGWQQYQQELRKDYQAEPASRDGRTRRGTFQRSPSESRASLLPEWNGSYQDAFHSIRDLAVSAT